MQRALNLAKRGHYTTSPNPRVGCVLVNNHKIVGEGYHARAGLGHAEVIALKQAGTLAKGATAYVTLEPCSHFGKTPPCAQALINAGVKHVIAAMVDPNPKVSGNGLNKLKAAEITTEYGLLAQDAQLLNVGFIQLMTTKKPYVRCKLAVSLDGKTAMSSGESQWITSPEARRNVQRLRAQSCAIISGADSVIFDEAKMNVRWSELGNLKNSYAAENIRQPVRVLIDSQNRLTPNLAIFQIDSPIIICTHNIEKKYSWPHFVEHISVPLMAQPSGNKKLDLNAVIVLLGERGLNDVLIESGAKLTGAFVEQNLVDELIMFQAPTLIGADGKGMLNMPSVQRLSQSKKITFSEVIMVGKDLRITAKIDKS